MKDVILKELKKIDWQKLKVYQKPILGGLVGAGLIASYFVYKDYFPSTDNAYANANIINMIPKVNGYITHIYVNNNQHVKKGDLLLEIDQKDYQLLLNQAKLDYKLAKKAAISAESDIQQANANIIKLKTPQKIKKHSICHQRYTYPPWFAGTLSLPPGYDQFDAYSRFVVFPQKYNAWIQRLSHHLFSQAR